MAVISNASRESRSIDCYTGDMSENEESPLKFPCQFPVKAMGKSDCKLDEIVVEIIRKHAPDLGEGAVTNRDSTQGNYTSVTVVVNATSREQLDAIYQDLVDCEAVIMAL
jgi:putative lipoic acid-binding regulatory protein